MARVIYENISKRFGRFLAVKNFNLEVEDHEFLCLVGPSGCGKTTTLRMLAGLDSVTEGTIKIGDTVVNDVQPKDREIAMVFQSYALYPHYNVYDNLAFGLRSKTPKGAKWILRLIIWALYIGIIIGLYGLGELINLFLTGLGTTVFIGGVVSFFATIVLFSEIRKYVREKVTSLVAKKSEKIRKYVRLERDIEEKVENTSKLLEIEKQLYKKPKQLSGGQRQRVALGRAIIRNPKVFLLDEPLSNLDAKLRVQMRAELQRLSQKLGVTSIYVTHDQIEAMTLGHRIAVMNEGELLQVGTPDEVYLRPANKFVAGFIGSPSMNFLEGRIEQVEGDLFFISDILEYKIPSRYNTLKGYIGKEVILGVRPEHISINLKTDDENIFPVKVGVVEPIGSDTFIYIDFPEEFVMIVKMEGLTNLQVDENVNVAFNQKQIHFFEKETENRIPPKEA